jgi:hypothetical protein
MTNRAGAVAIRGEVNETQVYLSLSHKGQKTSLAQEETIDHPRRWKFRRHGHAFGRRVRCAYEEVEMAPLDEERVRKFAAAKGIPNVDAFFEQIDAANLWRF